ncbi:MAG TPA: hypothetical protein VMX76_02020 [Nevskiaceae bacterium]|nr:hypothetical protein [Nevskiaceae bacterium]
MKKCKACQKEIDDKATKCPHCQTDLRSWFRRHPILTGLGVFTAFIAIIGMLGSPTKEESVSTARPETTTEEATTSKPEEKTEEEKVVEKPTPTEELQQTGADLLPPREEAKGIVKAKAESKWEDDYSMVKYEIDKQMEAYDWLAKQNTHLDIMKRAKQKWEDDYSMVKYEYEKQVEAYESL